MLRLSTNVACLLALCFLAEPGGAAQLKPHEREFWRAIARNHYAVPAGSSAFDLARELSANLASPDAELRDDLAYSIFYVWIVAKPQLTSEQLFPFLEEWQANLRSGIGESGTDSVFRRSFSALCLVDLAERDLKTPFLGEARYRHLLDDALSYLNDERDLRGFDPVKGWIHSTAHTADLLQALARNPLFTQKDQLRLLDAVALRLSSAHQVYAYGEQSRLAAAVASVVTRSDFNAAGFSAWLTPWNEKDAKVWNDSPPNDDRLKALENDSYFLEALAARLSGEPKSPNLESVLRQVAGILQKR